MRFLFDFISPYAYLASTQIHALAERHGRDVELVPVLFAAMLDANGNKGPAEIPPKREYLFKNVLRIARDFGVPLVPPPSHPFNPLIALRAASVPMPPADKRRLVDAVFRAVWGGGDGADDAAKVTRALNEAKLDGNEIVRAAQSRDAKDRLRAQTDAAIRAGVFGVPTIDVGGELFWGTDSLPHVERFLRGEDPVTKDMIERWRNVAPSATRRPH